jgi:hypothetical protein
MTDADEEAFLNDKFDVGDKVICNDQLGTVMQLWADSSEAKSCGRHELDKYRVKLLEGSTWVYGCDLLLARDVSGKSGLGSKITLASTEH